MAPALEKLLGEVQVLLTLPDSTVVNSKTAKTLILNAYLRRIPIVGYSRAFVKAGALLAVHSTPQELGRQAGEVLARALGPQATRLPLTAHPSYYSVSVNYQVARALDIDLPTEDELLKALRALEATK